MMRDFIRMEVIIVSFNFNWNAVSGGAPYVTVSNIAIAFNSVSIERLGSPEKIIIGFDEENCVIGIKAYCGEVGAKPYDFSTRIKSGWVRIGCRDFVKYLSALTGQSFSPAKKYIAHFSTPEQILYVLIRESDCESIENELQPK